MRLVHLADLHLGYRQFQRLTETGANQREVDVAVAFRAAIDKIIALHPDIVLIAGDVFHAVRPPNPAILAAFQHLHRLTTALPEALVVMIAGNHDVPRAAETGCILRLFRQLGIHVVDSAPQRLSFPERGISVLAVPDTVGAALPDLRPDPEFATNILVLHGEIEGMIPHDRTRDRATMTIPPEALGTAQWNYVALGDYHVCRQIAPNAFYSGSIEYTSTNFWGELVEERQGRLPGKGMIEYDLVRRTHVFHHIPSVRRFIDLPSFSADGLSAADIDRLVREAVDGCRGGIDDNVVRLVITDVPRHIVRDLDHQAVRAYKRRALHFQLDPRRPQVIARSGSGGPGYRPSLVEIVREQLRTRPLESDLDRDALVALGLRYLSDAEALATATPESDGIAP